MVIIYLERSKNFIILGTILLMEFYWLTIKSRMEMLINLSRIHILE